MIFLNLSNEMLGSAFKRAMTTYSQILGNWTFRTIFQYCSTLQPLQLEWLILQPITEP
jgi:hypothetical protein